MSRFITNTLFIVILLLFVSSCRSANKHELQDITEIHIGTINIDDPTAFDTSEEWIIKDTKIINSVVKEINLATPVVLKNESLYNSLPRTGACNLAFVNSKGNVQLIANLCYGYYIGIWNACIKKGKISFMSSTLPDGEEAVTLIKLIKSKKVFKTLLPAILIIDKKSKYDEFGIRSLLKRCPYMHPDYVKTKHPK